MSDTVDGGWICGKWLGFKERTGEAKVWSFGQPDFDCYLSCVPCVAVGYLTTNVDHLEPLVSHQMCLLCSCKGKETRADLNRQLCNRWEMEILGKLGMFTASSDRFGEPLRVANSPYDFVLLAKLELPSKSSTRT